MTKLTILAVLAATFTSPVFGQAPPPPASQKPLYVSVTYGALRVNAPVGSCDCFWTNGGTAELAVPVWRHLSGVGELSGERTDNIPGYGVGLSLVSYMAGTRLSRPMHTRYAPFAQALFGGVHAFDSGFPSSSGLVGKADSFAMATGGGLDISMTTHVQIRAFQIDYQYMQLPNGSTNQQHDIRVSGGVVFRFFR
jgi:outer membrane immunogenic protein